MKVNERGDEAVKSEESLMTSRVLPRDVVRAREGRRECTPRYKERKKEDEEAEGKKEERLRSWYLVEEACARQREGREERRREWAQGREGGW